MKKLLSLLLLISGISGECAWAQTEATLYFMNSIPQVVEANPAIIPRYKTSIGLPGISGVAAIYSNNGFTYNDMTSTVNGVVQADLSKWTSNLAEENYIQMAASVDLFRVGLRISPKVYIMASSTAKTYQRTMLPKGLASLFVDGTAPLVGTYSNTSPKEEQNAIISTSIGMGYQANSKLTLGGRIKYLMGQTNITTESSSLIVQVNNNYQINATGQAVVHTSGINDLNRSGYTPSFSDYAKNNGWGLDIGATYKFMDKLTVGASIVDLGFINWRNNTYKYTLDPAKANYTFSGFDVNELINGNNNYLSAQLDSLKKKFEMTETPSGSYTTMLPGKFYLSGQYELIKDLNIGVLFFGEKYKDRLASGMTAAVNKNFGKWVSTSLSYTVSNRSYNNIGLGVSFNLTPVQIYVVGDNLLRAPASLIVDQTLNSYLNSTQLLTVRAGLNIVMGWDKGTVKKEKVSGESLNPMENDSNAKVKPTYGRSPAKKDVPKAKKKSPPKKKQKKPAKSKVGR